MFVFYCSNGLLIVCLLVVTSFHGLLFVLFLVRTILFYWCLIVVKVPVRVWFAISFEWFSKVFSCVVLFVY